MAVAKITPSRRHSRRWCCHVANVNGLRYRRCSCLSQRRRRSAAAARPGRRRLPAAQRLDAHAGRPASHPARPAAQHPPAGRRQARPRRHQRLQPARARRSSTSNGPAIAEVAKVQQSWFGLATDAKRRAHLVVGGGGNMLHTFDLDERQARPHRPAEPDRSKMTREELAKLKGFRSGSALDPNGDDALRARHRRRHDHRPEHGRRQRAQAARRSAAGRTTWSRSQRHRLYVSDWAGRRCSPSIPTTSASSPGSRSASTRTRSPCTRRTTGCSSPAPRATASR